MVLIKNWKTKTYEEFWNDRPRNDDGKYYVFLTMDGLVYFSDLILK